MKELEAFLPFWKQLTKAEQDSLNNTAMPMSYPKGTIMRQCDQGCLGIMALLSGQLRVYIVSEEGREVTLFRVDAGNVCVLSAAGLMDAFAFEVMIDAVEDTKTIMIPTQMLEPLIHRYPAVEAYLYRTATERFSDAMWMMQQILFLGADKRIAILLWDEMTRRGEMTITMTHDEIARYIGSAREVVTKLLKYFAEEGTVSLGRGRVTILDKEKLKKYL